MQNDILCLGQKPGFDISGSPQATKNVQAQGLLNFHIY